MASLDETSSDKNLKPATFSLSDDNTGTPIPSSKTFELPSLIISLSLFVLVKLDLYN